MKTCLWLALGSLTNYSIWLAMFVNGARIGMVKTITTLARNAIRKAHRMVRSGFCVAGRGSIFQTISTAPIILGQSGPQRRIPWISLCSGCSLNVSLLRSLNRSDSP